MTDKSGGIEAKCINAAMTCTYNSKFCCLAHFKGDGCTTLQHEVFTRQGERNGVPVSNSLGSSEDQWSMAPGFRLARFASLESLIHPQTAEREKTATVRVSTDRGFIN